LPQGESRAERINRVCARCHQVLFSHYPFTWEGGERRQNPGGSHINSGEARDLLLGGCSRKLSCVTCHDPHAPDQKERLAQFESPATGNRVCTECHADKDGAAALRAHSHHAPDGPGGLCIACHMPRKNMSLDHRLTRYHRIGSPDSPEKVESDRPLECALCHGDKSVGELVDRMEQWWGCRYDRKRIEALYGDLGANPLLATLERGKPHEQATAIGALGEQRARAAAPSVAALLTHPYPIVRFFAENALAAMVGSPPPIDVHQDNAQILEAAKRWLAGFGWTLPSNERVGASSPDDEEE
jgi:predicted CXXCH cytochrome family protein